MAEVATSYYRDIDRIFSFDLPWRKLSGANILVVGSTGLIGSCLIDVLMRNPNRDYRVFAGCRNPGRAGILFSKYLEDNDFRLVPIDVLESIELEEDFHYIINAASGASPKDFSEHPVEVIKANVLGVANLLDFGLTHGLRRFLYVSSGEVYGEGNGSPWDENDCGYVNQMLPRACYPSSKRAAETLCSAYSAEYGTEIVVARLCHTYGPYFTGSDNRAFAQFFRSAAAGENITLSSKGLQYRSWCYVVDAVNALLHILLKGENGSAYNVADKSSNVTIFEFASLIAESAGKTVSVPDPEEAADDTNRIISKATFLTERLESLGWKTMHTIEENIKSTIEECRSYEKNRIKGT